MLLKLHVGDTIHQEPAWAICALEERDEVTRFVELIRGGETGRARTDDGDFLAGALFWRLGLDPTFVPGLVDDGALDILNRDGWLDEAEDARAFARSGADAASEFWEVVGLGEAQVSIVSLASVDEVVEFWDEIVNWATARHVGKAHARVAVRRAAIHAA